VPLSREPLADASCVLVVGGAGVGGSVGNAHSGVDSLLSQSSSN